MTRIGLRRHVRGALATALGGTAAVLAAAAGLAETVAQELRLTLPDDGESPGPESGVPEPDVPEPDVPGWDGVRTRRQDRGQDLQPAPAPATEVIAPPEDAVAGQPVTGPRPGTTPPRAVPGGTPLDEALPPDLAPEADEEAELPAPADAVAPETVLDDESSPIPPAPAPTDAEARLAGYAHGGDPAPWADDVAATVAEGTVKEAAERLPELTAPQLRALERYEREHRGRVTLLRAIDAELSLRG